MNKSYLVLKTYADAFTLSVICCYACMNTNYGDVFVVDLYVICVLSSSSIQNTKVQKMLMETVCSGMDYTI